LGLGSPWSTNARRLLNGQVYAEYISWVYDISAIHHPRPMS
jgi:hypothetical protein